MSIQHESYYVILEAGDEARFLAQVEHCLTSGQRLFYFRDTTFGQTHLSFLKQLFAEIHRAEGKVMVNDEILLHESGADGLHLKAHRLAKFTGRPANISLLAASCHNEKELKQAEMIPCDFVVLSPVNATPKHAIEAALGWKGFQRLVKTVKIPVYALGGVLQSDLALARQHGAIGIAGIRTFQY